VPEPFAGACCPAGAAGRLDRAGLAAVDPAPPCGFFPGGWPAGGIGALLPAAGAAGAVAALAAAAGFAPAAGFALAAGFAEADGFPEAAGFAGATDFVEVSLLITDGFADAAGAAGAVPPAAVAAPGTGVGYRRNRTYCRPRVHTLVVTQ
jgi:hypothetical protein